MNEHELITILNVMRIKDLKLKEKKWEKIKERILFLAEPFFIDHKQCFQCGLDWFTCQHIKPKEGFICPTFKEKF